MLPPPTPTTRSRTRRPHPGLEDLELDGHIRTQGLDTRLFFNQLPTIITLSRSTNDFKKNFYFTWRYPIKLVGQYPGFEYFLTHFLKFFDKKIMFKNNIICWPIIFRECDLKFLFSKPHRRKWKVKISEFHLW